MGRLADFSEDKHKCAYVGGRSEETVFVDGCPGFDGGRMWWR
jgi:hypothetical protein